eukprot:GILK01000236.1.p1 GENE.GILK01000236.1~~GILK01000236.1.p1  ORF type:complete len:865 (-),score=129.20 GILK01000236.1:1448-4042(-)
MGAQSSCSRGPVNMKVAIAVVYILALLAQPYASLGMTMSSFKSTKQHLATGRVTKAKNLMRNDHVSTFARLSRLCLSPESEEACDDSELLSAAAYAIEYTRTDDLSATTLKPLLELVILAVQKYSEDIDISQLRTLVDNVDAAFDGDKVLEALKQTFAPRPQSDERATRNTVVTVAQEEEQTEEQASSGPDTVETGGQQTGKLKGEQVREGVTAATRQDEKEQDDAVAPPSSLPGKPHERPTSTSRGGQHEGGEQQQKTTTVVQTMLLEETLQSSTGEGEEWIAFLLLWLQSNPETVIGFGVTVIVILVVHLLVRARNIRREAKRQEQLERDRQEKAKQEKAKAEQEEAERQIQQQRLFKEKQEQIRKEQEEKEKKLKLEQNRLEKEVAVVSKFFKDGEFNHAVITPSDDLTVVQILRKAYKKPEDYKHLGSILSDWISAVREFFKDRPTGWNGCDSNDFAHPDKYVGIAGAGVSGLAAALYTLEESKSGAPVKVLERAAGFKYSHILTLTANSFAPADIQGMRPLLMRLLPKSEKGARAFVEDFLHGVFEPSLIQLSHRRLCAFLALSLQAAGACLKFSSEFDYSTNQFDAQPIPNRLVLATSTHGAAIVQAMHANAEHSRNTARPTLKQIVDKSGNWEAVDAGLVHRPHHIVVAVKPRSVCDKSDEEVKEFLFLKPDGDTCHLELSFVVGQNDFAQSCHDFRTAAIASQNCISNLVRLNAPLAAPMEKPLQLLDSVVCKGSVTIMEKKCWPDEFRVLFDVENYESVPLLSFTQVDKETQATRHVLLVGDLVRDAIPDGAMGANDAHHMGRAAGKCFDVQNPAACYQKAMQKHEIDVINAINLKAASEYRSGFLAKLIDLLNN